MCFKREVGISALSSKPLKLTSTYLGNRSSSTKRDVDIRIVKVWTDICRLSIIWKSNLFDKIKWDFFQVVAVSKLVYGCSTWTLTKYIETKPGLQLRKNAKSYLEQLLEATPQETTSLQLLTFHLKNYASKTNKICRTLMEKKGRITKWRSSMDPYT